mgnify:CR=1 FL=1
MLSAEGISYGTRDREILYEISLRAEAGEFVGIIGPMGAEVHSAEEPLQSAPPQGGAGIPHGGGPAGHERPGDGPAAGRGGPGARERLRLTVEEVVRMGRHARKGLLEADNGQDRSLVDRVLRLTQLEEVREQSYTTLSGGRSSGCSSPGPWSRTPPA